MKKWLVALLLIPAAVFGEIRQSYYYMPFSNGFGAVVYQAKDGKSKLLYFYDHIYKAFKQGQVSTSVLKKSLQFGVNGMWLEDAKLLSAEYLPGTGIVKAVKQLGSLITTEYYFMPMASERREVIAILEISNTGRPTGVAPYFYNDCGVGGASGNEAVSLAGGVYTETKASGDGGYSMMMAAPGAQWVRYIPSAEIPDELKKNPIPLFGSSLTNGKNLSGFVQFTGGVLTNGQVMRVWVILDLADRDAELATRQAMMAMQVVDPMKCLANEVAWWDKWHSVERLPAGMAADEQRLYRQSTAILKMGQCREPGAPYGQILASMPPGEWNITWPRDGAYSIVALVRSGHTAEAKAFLEFMLNAPNGRFNGENYVGRDYKISVCRYWGNGEEESDLNNSGPNLEWDDFGLFLWAFAEYVQKSGDTAFLNKWYDTVKTLVADVLVSLMTPDGYLVRDSSIWERHWEPQGNPDGRKFFAFSTINAANGLARFSQIARSSADKTYYKQMADKIKAGFLANFLVDNVIVANLEEKAKGITGFMDAAVVEAINHGLVGNDVARATLAAFEQYLKMKNSPGFFRNDDGTWYDKQEWVVMDFRIASAYLKLGQTERAKELYRWVVDNAVANFYLIPELLEENNNAFKGAIPMCGFGAGAYVITTYDLYAR